MLVARRDPPFHVDAQDALSADLSAYPPPKKSKLARFVTAIQLTGSLLAVPVGIASAYSFYLANFSPETTCQSLRSNIVAMLDKSVDASTRRMLVRRDVEAFEKACGTVDPDATAAFKTLLAVEKTAAPAVAVIPNVPKAQRNETVTKEAVRKAEPRPQPPAKQPVTATAPAIAEPIHRDPAISDTQWLDAVRAALVTHKEDARTPAPKPAPAPDVAKLQPMPSPPARPASPAATVAPNAAPAAAPVAAPAATPAPAIRPAPAEAVSPPPPVNVATPTAEPSAAPPLPPAIPIGPPPAAVQATDSHPVPPESIPDSAPPANADAAKPDEHGRSRIGKWISAVPLLGPVIDSARR
jgi:hypothetical protein